MGWYEDVKKCDLNGDGFVTDADIEICEKAWLTTPGDPNWDPRCDFNEDGMIDILDLAFIGGHYGATTIEITTFLVGSPALLGLGWTFYSLFW